VVCVVDRPRLKAFKEGLPKKTSLHRPYTADNILDDHANLSDLIANVNDWVVDPSANTYVRSPITSLYLIVPFRINVE